MDTLFPSFSNDRTSRTDLLSKMCLCGIGFHLLSRSYSSNDSSRLDQLKESFNIHAIALLIGTCKRNIQACFNLVVSSQVRSAQNMTCFLIESKSFAEAFPHSLFSSVRCSPLLTRK